MGRGRRIAALFYLGKGTIYRKKKGETNESKRDGRREKQIIVSKKGFSKGKGEGEKLP